MDDSTRQLWESTVGSLPKLVAPSSCFSPGVPSPLEAFTAVAGTAPTGEYNIYLDGRSVDSRLSKADRSKLCLETLFYTNNHEAPNRDLKVFDIYNHGLPYSMRVPAEFNATTLESMSAFSMLVTPPGTYSDLHNGTTINNPSILKIVLTMSSIRSRLSSSNSLLWNQGMGGLPRHSIECENDLLGICIY